MARKRGSTSALVDRQAPAPVGDGERPEQPPVAVDDDGRGRRRSPGRERPAASHRCCRRRERGLPRRQGDRGRQAAATPADGPPATARPALAAAARGPEPGDRLRLSPGSSSSLIASLTGSGRRSRPCRSRCRASSSGRYMSSTVAAGWANLPGETARTDVGDAELERVARRRGRPPRRSGRCAPRCGRRSARPRASRRPSVSPLVEMFGFSISKPAGIGSTTRRWPLACGVAGDGQRRPRSGRSGRWSRCRSLRRPACSRRGRS